MKKEVNGYRLNSGIKTYDQLKSIGISLLSGKILHGHEGYWNWKFRLLNDDYIIYGAYPIVNARYMRYAEVLLLAAEANFQSGKTENALKYLNLVRVRAKLNPKLAITLNDIKIERRLELFDEGCRWMDLVRWGDAATTLKDKGVSIMGFDSNTEKSILEYTNSASKGFVAGKHEFLPIPQTEVTLNSSIKQNQNW